jgi:putative tryptophan/tyrosine transport system substrate-binding protein
VRILTAVLAAMLLAGTQASAAEVAVLKSSDLPAWRPALDALQRAAATHMFTEHDLRGDRAHAEIVIKALKGKATIIVAVGPLAAELAAQLQPEMPLVFCMVQDPARSGINPGVNVTGVSFGVPARNQLAAYHLVHPAASRIGVLYNEESTGKFVQEAEKAASIVGVELVTKAVASEKDVPSALRSLLKGANAVHALWLIPEPLLLGEESRRHVLSETLNAGRPIYSFSASLVAEGALVASGPDYVSIGERAGELVGRLASGERKIEVVVPRAELVVNTKIASKLKIVIPPAILKAAKTF